MTPHGDAELIAAAEVVRGHAHAPYSRFLVGAAVRMDGRVFVGVNVENASYPVSVCAERNAIAAGVAAGARHIEAIAVVTDVSPPSSPCGACRQAIAEFAPAATVIVAVNPSGERRAWTLGELLPAGFSGRELP